MAGNIKPSNNNMWQITPEEGLNDPVTLDPEPPGPFWGYASGQIYTGPVYSQGNVTPANNFCSYFPLYVPNKVTIDQLVFCTGSTFSGTSTVRLGVYNTDPVTRRPSTVLVDAGTVTCTASNTQYFASVNETLSPELYWLAFVTQGAATTNSYLRHSTLYVNTPLIPAGGAFGIMAGYYETGVTGAFATAGTYGVLSPTLSTGVVTVAIRVA